MKRHIITDVTPAHAKYLAGWVYPPDDPVVAEMLEKIRTRTFLPEPPIVIGRNASGIFFSDGRHRLSAVYHSGRVCTLMFHWH